MKQYLLIFLFLFNGYYLFGQNPYKQNIANLVSVTFPEKPSISDTLGNMVTKFIDSTGMYTVINREIDPQQLLFKPDKLAEFYDPIIKGYVKGTKGKLIEKKIFEVQGFKGIEIETVASPNPNLPDLRYARMILLNNTLITINFWTLSENKQATETARKQFFNSLTINADQTTITQGNNPSGYSIGVIIGKILIWATLIGIVAVLILLIRKWKKKGKTPALGRRSI